MDSRSFEADGEKGGYFSTNLINFVRLLRHLDIHASSKQIISLAEGISFIDISRKDDFYHLIRSILLHDIEKLDLFDLAFDLFWSRYIKYVIELPGKPINPKQVIKELRDGDEKIENQSNRRLVEDQIADRETIDFDDDEVELKPIYSDREVLYSKDFSEFNKEELKKARDLINNMVWDLEQKRTRRKIRSIKTSRNMDFRRMFRRNIKFEGEIVKLEWRKRKLKSRPIIVISDISGSMEKYSQIFLFLLYAMAQRSRQIETFVFGTRLTRVTPALRKKNVELVLSELSDTVLDWSGGTRIGQSLKEFNYHWSRRVGSQNSILVIISDGWDRGDIALLDKEISRLQRTVHRIIWLNPLAGSPEYQPLVKGMQAALPYIDDFYPLKNLINLEAIASRLSALT